MRSQRSILIADDQQSLRLLLRATLGRGMFRVVEATTGGEVQALVRRERPDLVLLDVGMPELDGYSVCRALKSDPQTAAIPIVMLTARAQPADRERGAEAGADAYLTKPFKPTELRETVRRLLEPSADAAAGSAR